jgi:hypothetical protein
MMDMTIMGMANTGRTKEIKIMIDTVFNICCMKNAKSFGIDESIVSKSLENRLRILPTGVVSISQMLA